MRTVLFSLVLATVAGLASVAHAQDFEAAGKHFSAAQEAFGAHKFKTAAGEFEAAYAISKDPVLLFNIGESYEKAGDGHKAVASYKQYLKDQPAAADKSEVQKRIRSIEAKHLRLVDQSAPDDRPAAATTTAPIAAATPAAPATPSPAAPQAAPAAAAPPASESPPASSAAPAQSAQGAPGTLPESTAPNTSALPPSTVAPATTPTPERAAEPTVESTQGTKEPAPAPPPALGLIDEGPPSRLRVAAWIGVASTLALLTAGAVFGLAAQSRADEITRQLSFVSTSGQPNQFTASTASTLNQLKSDGHLYNGLGIGFFTASAASAVATVVLFVVDAKRPKPAKDAASHALRFTPVAGRNAAGLSLQGSF
jgi:tetratricopeptide (TPR) repeat protein